MNDGDDLQHFSRNGVNPKQGIDTIKYKLYALTLARGRNGVNPKQGIDTCKIALLLKLPSCRNGVSPKEKLIDFVEEGLHAVESSYLGGSASGGSIYDSCVENIALKDGLLLGHILLLFNAVWSMIENNFSIRCGSSLYHILCSNFK